MGLTTTSRARREAGTLAWIALMLLSPTVPASVVCIDPPLERLYRDSTVVVSATAEDVSHRRIGTTWRETILWRVDEQWKGPHFEGSTFTTRNGVPEHEKVARGQSFLLLLSGREPYAWETCVEDKRRLQDSLRDVERLYREFRNERETGS